nr:bifunctional glutamate N-acetyltransferase/amino-acid acetyltransferase ArgJ [Desulfobacterales bacterium]
MRIRVSGFLAGGIASGLKEDKNKDLALIFSEVPADAAGVFTTNRIQAAPVLLSRERIRSGKIQAIVANSGNANACTGVQGLRDARLMAMAAARALSIPEHLVAVASTGIIGQSVNVVCIEKALPGLAERLSPDGFPEVAQAIMTTDKSPKVASGTGKIHGKTFNVISVAKGAGMIRPDMATMLCFICTDLGAEPAVLDRILRQAVARSFNAITVDGDTSTNDTVLIMANGLSGCRLRDYSSSGPFQEVLDEILIRLAKEIVRDGEGATKLVTLRVRGALSDPDARAVADAVANSILVKTALFGEDANWGRILAAAGRAGVPINPDLIDLYFDGICLVKCGIGVGDDLEGPIAQVLKRDQFTITLDLNMGSGEATVYTCDLSFDYVRINAHYRS